MRCLVSLNEIIDFILRMKKHSIRTWRNPTILLSPIETCHISISKKKKIQIHRPHIITLKTQFHKIKIPTHTQ